MFDPGRRPLSSREVISRRDCVTTEGCSASRVGVIMRMMKDDEGTRYEGWRRMSDEWMM